jgi:hypothetical protein
LAPSDYERLIPWEGPLTSSLAELVQEYLDENRWETIGDIEVYLARDEDLHTGVFGVASRMASDAPPRRRPYDSLSMPVVPGLGSDEYPDQSGAEPAHAAMYSSQAPSPAPVMPAPPTAAPQAPAAPQGPQGPGGQGYGAGAPQNEPGGYPPPSPPRGGTAMLVVDQTQQRFDLRVGSNVIGRGSDCDLQLLDQGISRRHVDVRYDGNTATAYDLGSTNGTTVNGREIGSQLLRHGDVLRIGHTRISFHQASPGYGGPPPPGQRER